MTVSWGQPMPRDLAAEFQRLCDQRDLAAYRAVSVISSVIDFWEAEDYPSALAQLQRARAEFLEAEARITKFRKSPQIQKGEHSHGNRSAV